MKTRASVARFIEQQMFKNSYEKKHGKYHYGMVELKDLMDFIYEDTPNTKEEKIRWWNSAKNCFIEENETLKRVHLRNTTAKVSDYPNSPHISAAIISGNLTACRILTTRVSSNISEVTCKACMSVYNSKVE
jgi:hypothetical protein